VQENFNPRENNQPSGPLYGVQFSQLSCSDLMRRVDDGTVGPKRSPLGLSADPGGLPLYKNNRLVGGVGVIADGLYSLDQDITDIDQDMDEIIAVAGMQGFNAPDDIRAERITADGRTFRFVDSESLASNTANAPAFTHWPAPSFPYPAFSMAPSRPACRSAMRPPVIAPTPAISPRWAPSCWSTRTTTCAIR